ncbi:uncharacterized protein [Miscanthus floridulus]|uniref:uncharacterized protein isoform X2 n=1 Tax=Miscanthus floridulus TaxID=154761 RepID=UPI00345937F4
MRSNGDQATVPLEEDESGTSETGTCGVVGYVWTSVDTGIVEERRQSIAPIPKEKLEELRHAASDDDGSEDESNNPTLPDKDDSSDNVVEDDDHISKFEKEVEETFQRALGGGVNRDNLILEINGLRAPELPTLQRTVRGRSRRGIHHLCPLGETFYAMKTCRHPLLLVLNQWK